MNPEPAVMASRSAVQSPDSALPAHWIRLDRVPGTILHSTVTHQEDIARLRGLAVGSDVQLALDILVRLVVAGVTEPRGIPACTLLAMRLLWRSAVLTRQHRDMERAAQALRPGRSNA